MKTKLSLLLFTLLFSTVAVIAPSLVMEKYNGGEIADGKQFINQTWASISADPAVALSPPGVLNFTQKITVCNNANDSGYLFLDYNFNNDLVDHSFKWMNDHFVTTNENQPITTCEEIGVQPDNTTVCSSVDNFADVTRFYSSLEEITPEPIKTWEGGVHYVVTKGSLYSGLECRDYVLNYKPTFGVGKWNMRVWANTEDDYSCVEKETCPYDYILDPTFSTNYTYKQNIQLNFSTVNPATNNVTANIELTTTNYNFSRNLLNGDDFVFTNFDETQALGCFRESFVNGTLGNFSVLITNFSNTTNTSIWMYHGNPSATSNQFCAEISNAYLLADLMNTSSINTSVWNELAGSFWSADPTNGVYRSKTTAAQSCFSNSPIQLIGCGLLANTTGTLKQSQATQIYTRTKVGDSGSACGVGMSWGNTSNNYLGSWNVSMYGGDDELIRQIVTNYSQFGDPILASYSSNRTNMWVGQLNRRVNNMGASTIFENINSTGTTQALLLNSIRPNGSVSGTNFLNNSNKLALWHVDGSGASGACNTNGVLWDEIRIKAYVNTSIGLNMTGADGAVGSDGSINITNQTWEPIVSETGLGNYTVNVSWNANIVNAVYANFTITYNPPNVYIASAINSSGSNGGNMNWTQFNITLRTNFTPNTNTSGAFNNTVLANQWNFTIDINGTDLINNTPVRTQQRLWSYWINNVTWTSSVSEGTSNTFHFNLTKIIPQTGIVGLTYNITLEYNYVNQTPNATLVFNSTNYEDYDFTMIAPDVVVNTVYPWIAWINFSYQNRLTNRSNRSITVVVDGTQLVIATIPFAINNETFETTGLFDSGGISNYSINVTWDPNSYNNLSAVNFSINGFTYRDSQISNSTINGNTTYFNISVYTPMVSLNATTIGFNWTWNADGNVTDILGNNSNRSQNVMWGWYVNNLSYVSPIASMSPNNIIVNFTKHVQTPVGIYVNVTNEWNLTSGLSAGSFAYKKNVQVNSTQAYQAVNNYTVNVLLNLSNHNFNRTQPDGDDVAFYNYDETILLGCYKESFDNTTMGNYSVLITNLSNATNTSIWVFYGNTTMPNSCPEINSAYLLADLMNSSSINTSIWNEYQGTDFSADTTNGSYKSITTAGERCNPNTNTQTTPNCVLIANTTGVLKQSQTYQIDTRIKFDGVDICGWAIMFGKTSSNGAGTSNMSFEVNQDVGTEFQAFNENAGFLVPFLSSSPSTTFIKYRNIKINNNDARTLYSIFNSSTLSQEINLGTALNNSNPSTSFLNTSNKLTLMAVDESAAFGCVTTLWDEVRVRSYINSTLNYTFGTETAIMPSGSASGTNRTATQLLTNTSTYEEWNLTFSTPVVYQTTNVSTKGWLNISFNGTYVIRDPTFIQVVNPFSNFSYETPLYETSLANFTFNVSNSSPITNVNFTWNTTQFNSSNITNTSSGSFTRFNISIRLPLIPSNQSNYTFQWNMTLDNGTTFNTNLTNQTLLLAYYPNRIHSNASEIEGSLQNQIINVTKHIFAQGVQEFVNLEYNQTNYSSALYVNATNYQDYNAIFSTPIVTVDTTVQELGWLNISFGDSSIDGTVTYLRNTSNITQLISNINITGGTCSGTPGYNAVINFTFFDEFSNKSIKQNGSDQITIWSNQQQVNQTVGFNFINTNYTEICIACTNCNLTSNFNIQFSDNETTYTLREYWERLYNFNTTINFTKNITLYNLLNQNATEIVFNVADENNDAIQNVIVEIHKYNISNNSFKIVDTEITDFDGKARVRLFMADDYYKVVLRDGNNTIILETTLFKLLFTEYFISVVPTTTDIRTVIRLAQIPHNLTFDNGTKIVTLSWNDIENVTNNNCLEVVNITNATGLIINKQCSTNRSGYLTFNLTNINGTYIGKYTVGDNSFLIDAIEIILQPFINLGREGLWLAFIVIGTLAAIGLSIDPTVSIIFTLLGVIVMSLTGMLPIGWLTLTGIVAAGIITALVINKVQ